MWLCLGSSWLCLGSCVHSKSMGMWWGA
eukprot:COSAG01_NODE_23207_length_824_cov_1.030345_1_plen_27_part_01